MPGFQLMPCCWSIQSFTDSALWRLNDIERRTMKKWLEKARANEEEEDEEKFFLIEIALILLSKCQLI